MKGQQVQLQGQVAVVIGGTAGIGKAVAMMLAARGARVAVISRDAGGGDRTVREIAEAGGSASWFQADFMVFEQLAAAAQRVQSEMGACDILVAGGGPGFPRPKPFLETPPTDYADFFSSRCIGRLFAVRAFVEQMVAKQRGKVVLLTTDAGRVPTPNEVLNGSAAAALVFATRALARELTRHGIRVNAVSTTLTSGTPSYERFQAKIAAGGSADGLAKAFSRIEERTPLGGLNTPEDVAEAALFFASAASDRISGTVLSVNGGLSFP